MWTHLQDLPSPSLVGGPQAILRPLQKTQARAGFLSGLRLPEMETKKTVVSSCEPWNGWEIPGRLPVKSGGTAGPPMLPPMTLTNVPATFGLNGDQAGSFGRGYGEGHGRGW